MFCCPVNCDPLAVRHTSDLSKSASTPLVCAQRAAERIWLLLVQMPALPPSILRRGGLCPRCLGQARDPVSRGEQLRLFEEYLS